MKPSRKLLPEINTARCTGCGWCVAACPLDLLSLERQGWKKFSALHDSERCTGCTYCALKCPFNVITMIPSRPPRPAGGSADDLGEAS